MWLLCTLCLLIRSQASRDLIEDVPAQDPTANTVAISAMAIDGADNTYVVTVNETTRFAGYLRVYKLPKGQDNQPTTIGSATNAAINAAADIGLTGGAAGSGWSMPSSGAGLVDGPGAPGGFDAGESRKTRVQSLSRHVGA